LLKDHDIPYQYREVTEDPLSESEIRSLFQKLGVGPKTVLRKRDRAFSDLGLSGEEPDAVLISLMAKHPTLLQRPIGVLDAKAVVGRPPEHLLQLIDPGES